MRPTIFIYRRTKINIRQTKNNIRPTKIIFRRTNIIFRPTINKCFWPGWYTIGTPFIVIANFYPRGKSARLKCVYYIIIICKWVVNFDIILNDQHLVSKILSEINCMSFLQKDLVCYLLTDRQMIDQVWNVSCLDFRPLCLFVHNDFINPNG